MEGGDPNVEQQNADANLAKELEEKAAAEKAAKELEDKAAADKAAADKAAADKASADKAAADKAAADKAAADKAAADKAAADKAAADKAAADKAAADKAAADKAAADKAAKELEDAKAAADKAAKELEDAKAAADKAAADKAAADKAAADKAAADKAAADKAAADKAAKELEDAKAAKELEDAKAAKELEEKAAKELEEANRIANLPPKLVFIVPYRDREQQQKFFATQMKTILEDYKPEEYKIYYANQNDTRDFNRGALKNIGFLAMKSKYPNDYKNMTFVFNDVDTMPIAKNFLHYETQQGTVKHFYGYQFSLGGIVSINGGDFEAISGFPNLWAWGYEDNLLQRRVLEAGITIDRSEFYPIMDKNIFQMKDGLFRVVNRKEFDRVLNFTKEGIQSITDLQYYIDEDTGFININQFSTGTTPDTSSNITYDLRNGILPFTIQPKPVSGRRRPTMSMIHF